MEKAALNLYNSLCIVPLSGSVYGGIYFRIKFKREIKECEQIVDANKGRLIQMTLCLILVVVALLKYKINYPDHILYALVAVVILADIYISKKVRDGKK